MSYQNNHFEDHEAVEDDEEFPFFEDDLAHLGVNGQRSGQSPAGRMLVQAVILVSLLVVGGFGLFTLLGKSCKFYFHNLLVFSDAWIAAASTPSSTPEKVFIPVTYKSMKDSEIESMFQDFIDKRNRQYDVNGDEYNTRLGHFKNFLSTVDERNAKEAASGGSAVHGVTIFADYSPEEFKGLLGYKKKTAAKDLPSDFSTTFLPPKYKGSLTAVDWTGVYTTPVKDQGYCGSCWAFSATSQIESDAMRLLGVDYILSPQQIVSCDTQDAGCDGGLTEYAYEYVYEAGGLATAASYPYTSYYDISGSCESHKAVVTITGYSSLVSNDDDDSTVIESRMLDYVLSTGPLSICLVASTWDSYVSGVLSACPNDADDVDHCVQVVGVDLGTGAWKVRNQWSTDWGVNGFIYLKYGQNTCDITNDPTFVKVVKA